MFGNHVTLVDVLLRRLKFHPLQLTYSDIIIFVLLSALIPEPVNAITL